MSDRMRGGVFAVSGEGVQLSGRGEARRGEEGRDVRQRTWCDGGEDRLKETRGRCVGGKVMRCKGEGECLWWWDVIRQVRRKGR